MGLSLSFGRADNAQTAAPGLTVDAVTAVGTAQVGAASLPGFINAVTTNVGQTAVVLPANRGIGNPLVVNVVTATAGLVFPPVGGAINGGAANAAFSVAQNKPALCWAHPNGLDYTIVLSA